MFTYLSLQRRLRLASHLLLFPLSAVPISAAVEVTGDVTPADPADWNTTGPIIGNTGIGTVSVTSNSTVSLSGVSVNIAFGTGSQGALTVDGTGSQFTNARVNGSGGNIDVGVGGQGSLEIRNAGFVSAAQVWLRSALGDVMIDGVGSELRVTDSSLVVQGGSVSVTNGAQLTTTSAFSDSIGSQVTVDGGGSEWSAGIVGLFATTDPGGALDIQNGGSFMASGYLSSSGGGSVNVTSGGSIQLTSPGAAGRSLWFGQSGGSDDTLNVSGAGSSLSAFEDVEINRSSINVRDGGEIDCMDFLRVNPGSTVTVQGAGSTAAIKNLSISSGTGESSAAELWVRDGGQLTTSGFVNAGGDASRVVIEGVSSIWNASQLSVGSGPLFEIKGGAKLQSASVIALGLGSPNTGGIDLSGTGSRVTADTDLSIYNGSARISDGAVAHAQNKIRIASTNSSVADAFVAGAGSQLNAGSSLLVGSTGTASGTLRVLDGGQTSSGSLDIGFDRAQGALLVSGVGSKSETTTSVVRLGASSDAVNRLTVADGGLVKAASHVQLVNANSTAYLHRASNGGGGTNGALLEAAGGDISNGGSIRVFADGGLAATGPGDPAYSVLAALGNITNSGSGTIKAVGGTLNSDFTLNASEVMSAPNGLVSTDASGGRYSLDGLGDLIVGFGADATDVNLSASALASGASNAAQFLAAYSFVDSSVQLGGEVLLSFYIGAGKNIEDLLFWYSADEGLTWGEYEPQSFSYSDGWVNFTVDSFSTYGVTDDLLDTSAPVIALTGSSPVILPQGGVYTELGATAVDIIDGSFPATVGGDTVDTNIPGVYTIAYDASDAAGNAADQVTRIVKIFATASLEYAEWADEAGLTAGGSDGLLVDANGDGIFNIQHFAFNSVPLGFGNHWDRIRGEITSGVGSSFLTITFPVREGAAFTGSTPPISAVSGITYAVAGGNTPFSIPNLSASEVSPALDLGMPALDAGWTYRTFRLNKTTLEEEQGFLRIIISEDSGSGP